MSLPNDNLILRTDSYKASHFLQYPPNTTRLLDGRWTTMDDVSIPGRWRDLFESVEGRHDVSSTELRRLSEVGAAGGQ